MTSEKSVERKQVIILIFEENEYKYNPSIPIEFYTRQENMQKLNEELFIRCQQAEDELVAARKACILWEQKVNQN